MFKLRKNKKQEATPIRNPRGSTKMVSYSSTVKKRLNIQTQINRSYNPQSDNNSQKRKLAKLSTIAPISLILLAMLATQLSVSSPNLKINGQQYYRTYDEYNNFITNELKNRSLAWLKLTINHEQLQSNVEKQFPELSDIRVKSHFYSPQLQVKAVIDPPTFALYSNNEISLLSRRGKVIKIISSSDVESYSGLIKLENGSGVTDKQINIFTKLDADYLLEYIRYVDSVALTINKVVISNQPNTYFVYYIDKPGYHIIDSNTDTRQQLGGYLALSNKLSEQGQSTYEYIDARLGERVYYK